MQGAIVAISGRRERELSELAGAIVAAGAARPVILTADLAKQGAAEDLAARTLDALGSVDILINNAAVEGEGLYSDAIDDHDARQLFETNYWSPMALARAVIPTMRQRGQGTIVNVSSLGAITPIAGTGHYPSTKAALAVATEALRDELHSSGIRVVLVYPGFVNTPMLQAFRERPDLLPRWQRSLVMMPVGKPEELASLIVAAVRRGRKLVVYPRSFALAPHLPSLSRWVTRRLFPVQTASVSVRETCRWFSTLGVFRARCCARTSPPDNQLAPGAR